MELRAAVQDWESYVARRINTAKAFDFVPDPTLKHVRLQGFDYQKTKLYLMSLLWRAAVSIGPSFSHVALGPKHTERLRCMLLKGNPGLPHEYGCIVSVPHAKLESGELMSRIKATSNPDNMRLAHGLRVVGMMVDGLLLYFVIGAQDFVRRCKFAPLFLQADGSMVVGSPDVTRVAFVREGWAATILRLAGPLL